MDILGADVPTVRCFCPVMLTTDCTLIQESTDRIEETGEQVSGKY